MSCVCGALLSLLHMRSQSTCCASLSFEARSRVYDLHVMRLQSACVYVLLLYITLHYIIWRHNMETVCTCGISRLLSSRLLGGATMSATTGDSAQCAALCLHVASMVKFWGTLVADFSTSNKNQTLSLTLYTTLTR